VVGGLKLALEFADFDPAIKIVIEELAVFDMQNVCQPATKKREGPLHVDYVNGHVMPVEHQNVAVQRGRTRIDRRCGD
jgi:hypothetical protein